MNSEEYLILFADLVGSTEVASEASPIVYSKLYIGSFHLAAFCAYQYINHPVFDNVKFKSVISEPIISGDEALSFSKIKIDQENYRRRGAETHESEDLVASAVAFSFVLKLFWMASPYNLLRLSEKKFPRDISVGIHLGPAERIFDDEKSDIAGLHINVAKRLETSGRNGQQSRIFASDDVVHIFKRWRAAFSEMPADQAPPLIYTDFERVESPLDLKGIPVRVSPFELKLDQKDHKKMQALITLSYDTPGVTDAQVETAVKVFCSILIDNLFSQKFSTLANMLPIEINNKTYIESWFEAIPSLPQIFFNDVWSAMEAFFISCGFMRQGSIAMDNIKKYQQTTGYLRSKLQNELNNH